MVAWLGPAITPGCREYAAMKLRTVLKIPTCRQLAVCRLSSSEISCKKRRHETWENQFAFNRIFCIVLVLIPLQTGNSLVGTTKFDAQLLTTSEEISVGISERSSSSQVTRRIGSLRLEGDGRRLVGTDLDIAIHLPADAILSHSVLRNHITVRNFRETDISILHRLQTGEVVISALQGGGTVGTAFSKSCGIEQYLVAQMDSVAVITQIVDVSDFISGMINLRSITVCLILHQM